MREKMLVFIDKILAVVFLLVLALNYSTIFSPHSLDIVFMYLICI